MADADRARIERAAMVEVVTQNGILPRLVRIIGSPQWPRFKVSRSGARFWRDVAALAASLVEAARNAPVKGISLQRF
jgi:hypothetical protein